MGLICCIACGRQRNVKPIKRKSSYVCSNCGAADPRLIRRLRVWMDSADRHGMHEEDAKHGTFAGLRWYAEQKGYKPGWASRKFKTIFGRWPNGEASEPPEPPGGQLMHWIGRQKAEYARMKRKEEKEKPGGRLADRAGSMDPSDAGQAWPATYQSLTMTEEDWEPWR